MLRVKKKTVDITKRFSDISVNGGNCNAQCDKFSKGSPFKKKGLGLMAGIAAKKCCKYGSWAKWPSLKSTLVKQRFLGMLKARVVEAFLNKLSHSLWSAPCMFSMICSFIIRSFNWLQLVLKKSLGGRRGRRMTGAESCLTGGYKLDAKTGNYTVDWLWPASHRSQRSCENRPILVSGRSIVAPLTE